MMVSIIWFHWFFSHFMLSLFPVSVCTKQKRKQKMQSDCWSRDLLWANCGYFFGKYHKDATKQIERKSKIVATMLQEKWSLQWC